MDRKTLGIDLDDLHQEIILGPGRTRARFDRLGSLYRVEGYTICRDWRDNGWETRGRQHPAAETKQRIRMPGYFAALIMVLMIAIILIRVLWMKRRGVDAMNFGKLDRTDFLIPPFALFYFYLVLASAFKFPTVSMQEFFQSRSMAWVGVIICLAGLLLVSWTLFSFGSSFRVGIDMDHPGGLVTSGVFAISRNPIYVGFALILVGQFLVFPNWILLVYTGAALRLFHRQVLREETYLKKQYGVEYLEYCQRVGRYI